MVHRADGQKVLRIRGCQLMDIDVRAVNAVLGGAHILKDVSMGTAGNRFIGVIGPNGSGKSTLLKCIYRVLKPSEGEVRFDGIPLQGIPVKESAKMVAVVAQHNYYNFEFSVEEVVLMGRAPYKKALERDNAEDYRIVKEALEEVGMTEFSHRGFSTLSGGEQQRVILARALAQQTPCLILDEPTNHLDIKFQLQLMDIVKSLNRTILSAIHDLNIAAMYCDYLYVMKNGQIYAQGTPEEILTVDLIRDVYEVDAEVFRDSKGILRILYDSLVAEKGTKNEKNSNAELPEGE